MTRPPAVQVRPEWESFSLPFDMGQGRSLYSNDEKDSRLRIKLYRNRKSGHIEGKVWFGAKNHGPPGYVHGGILSWVMDEAMGTAAWVGEYPGVARKLEFEFLEMVPVQTDMNIRAWVEMAGRKEILLKAQITNDKNKVYCSGQGLFHLLKKSAIARFLKAFGDSSFEVDSLKINWPEE